MRRETSSPSPDELELDVIRRRTAHLRPRRTPIRSARCCATSRSARRKGPSKRVELRDADRDRLRLARERAAVDRKIEAMLKAIEDGFYNPSMKERMAALEAEKLVLQSRLDQTDATLPVRLNSNLSAIYAEKAAKLADALGRSWRSNRRSVKVAVCPRSHRLGLGT
jgi:hypothetical protein